MTSHNTEPKRATTWTVIIIAIIAIAAAGYYYFDEMDDERAAPAPPPSTEWTTAPEGGLDVELPQAPMTNVPPETPSAEDTPDTQAQGEAGTS